VALYDPKIAHAGSTDGYWLAQGTVAGTVLQSQADPTQVGCAIATLHWSRVVPTGLREDLCACSFAIAKQSSSDRHVPAITDLATLEPFLVTFVGAMAPLQSSQYTWQDITWHFRVASALRDGPAVRRTAETTPGAASGARMPDQDSMTITLATPSRKHWGRVYYPGIAATYNDTTYGRITNAACATAANAADALASSCQTAGFSLGVWSKIGLAFLDVYGVHVDNVWDIQRRRRAKQRSFISTHGN